MHEVYAGLVMSHVDRADRRGSCRPWRSSAWARTPDHGHVRQRCERRGWARTARSTSTPSRSGSEETVGRHGRPARAARRHRFYNHYSWGWAWAGNTPFRLWKRYTWLGGTRTPGRALARRARGNDGEVRSRFSHAVDMMPTLSSWRASTPTGGARRQEPVPAFADRASSNQRTQYFEILGSRSVYQDGWKATTDHVIAGAAPRAELLEGSRVLRRRPLEPVRPAPRLLRGRDLAPSSRSSSSR